MFTSEAIRFVLASVAAICVVLGPFTMLHLHREGVTTPWESAQVAIGLVLMIISVVGYAPFGIGFTTLTFAVGQWIFGRVVWPAIPKLLERRFENKLKR